jgi:hypothetical protein
MCRPVMSDHIAAVRQAEVLSCTQASSTRTSACIIVLPRIDILFFSPESGSGEDPMDLTRTLDTWVFSCSPPVVVVRLPHAALVLAFDRRSQRGAGACLPCQCHHSCHVLPFGEL